MRIPLITESDSRDGSSNKDERLTNVLAEIDSEKMACVRPGLTAHSIPTGQGNGLVCFNGEVVCVYGNTIYAGVQRFTGAIDVTQVDLPIGYVGQSANKVGNIFCIVCGGGIKTSYASSDGVIWNTGTLPSITGDPSFSAVGYGSSLYVTFAYNKSACATSPDGLAWTQRSLPITGFWGSVVYGNGTFCCISVLSNVCVTSIDGITWESGVLPTGDSSWKSIAFNGSVFCIVSYTQYAVSADCVTWNVGSLPSGHSFSDIIAKGGVFVTISSGVSDSVAAVSSNGTSWVVSYLPTATTWKAVSANSNIFLAVASNPNTVAAYSSDGEDWTEISIDGLSNWNFVSSCGEMFLISDSVDDVALLCVGESITDYVVSGVLTNTINDFAQIP